MAIMNYFLWTEASAKRNQLTAKYEPLQPFLFVSFLEYARAQIVFDVGANVGVYSLMATLVDSVSSVYAFEPDRAAYKELQKNVLLNGVENKVELSDLVVSDRTGLVRFGAHQPMSGVNGVLESSIHEKSLFEDVREMTSTCLDQIVGLRGKTLGIKIDVEGHELQVIKGSVSLLKECPTLIQVEHYVGSKIDEALGELGYYRFFTAGHDHYFTNISNFADPLFLKRAVEYASTCLVESQSARWPKSGAIKNALSLSCCVKDKVIVAVSKCDMRFFSGEVEYAFYLMEDGVKVDEKWYQSEPLVEFPFRDHAKSIEVRGFVREKGMPSKKVFVGEYLKQPAAGYRAPSAVENSRDLPSQYSSLVYEYAKQTFPYSIVDVTSVMQRIVDVKPDHIVQLGADAATLDFFRCLQKHCEGRMTVVCTRGQECETIERLGSSGRSYYPNFEVLSISEFEDLAAFLEKFKKEMGSPILIVLRDQFLEDLKKDVASLSVFFEMVPKNSVLYAEAQANELHRDELSRLAQYYDIAIEWLYPYSTIISRSLLSVRRSSELAVNVDHPWGSLMERSHAVELDPGTRRAFEHFVSFHQPAVVLQFGITPLTLSLAKILKAAGVGQLYCVVESSGGLGDMQSKIKQGNLDSVLTLLSAHLEEWNYGYPKKFKLAAERWFCEQVLDRLPRLDWVVVDGPDWQGLPSTRYPALFSILEKLSSGAEVWMLGAKDDQVKEVVSQWCSGCSLYVEQATTEGVFRIRT